MSEVRDNPAHATIMSIDGAICVPEGMQYSPATIVPDEVVLRTVQRYHLQHLRGLDPMCGVGTIPRVIRRLGGECDAVEIDPVQHALASAALGGRGIVLGDCLETVPERPYDYVYTSVPFSWFGSRSGPHRLVAAAFARMLKPGGILLIDSDDHTTRAGKTYPLAARQIAHFTANGFRFDESTRFVAPVPSGGADAGFTELKFTRLEE